MHNKNFKQGERIPHPVNTRSEAEIIADWNLIDQPLVSIHCMTYNHEPYIRDAIEGFLIQKTNFAFEILIHDDASTDKTAQIINEYAKKYPKIIKPMYQTLNQYSQGYKVSLVNQARVKGKYIALCEGDDFWIDESKLQKQVDYLESNPGYVMCGHDVYEIKPNLDVIKESTLNLKIGKSYSQYDISLGSLNLPSKSAIWRADLPLPSVGMPWGDTFLFSYYGNFGKAYLFKERMGVYRRHDGGVWTGLNKVEQLKSSCSIYKRIPDYTISSFKSLAYFRYFRFLVNNETNLKNNGVEFSVGTAFLGFVKNLNIKVVLYVFYRFIGSSFKKILRRVGRFK